ncbi:hypothetical protein TKK_0013315 [Trichogramma kaykai]|uniref:Uncharacterized protein n=1 Tax=Trichogramma kaykai TaxID=54128 RepID=A0ABD2WJV3_9HYME
MIKQLRGWRSHSVASGYIADSVRCQNLIFEGIVNNNEGNLLSSPSTTTETTLSRPSTTTESTISRLSTTTGTTFSRPSSATENTLSRPSTSKNNSCQISNNEVVVNIEIADLQLCYEDFCEEFNDSSELLHQNVHPPNLSVNFKTAND